MEKMLVASNFMSWPNVKTLLPDQKLIARELWCNLFVKNGGVYELPIEMFSTSLSLLPDAVAGALRHFEQIGLVTWDEKTGEIYNNDWLKFHTFKGWALDNYWKDFEKIQSEKIKKIVLEKSNLYRVKKLDLGVKTSEEGSKKKRIKKVEKVKDENEITKEAVGCSPVSVTVPVSEKATTTNAVAAFYNSAKSEKLVGHEELIKKSLGLATIKQAELAGLAFGKMKNITSVGGLLVNLCTAAARGEMTGTVENEDTKKRKILNDDETSIKKLIGKKFKGKNGKIFKIVPGGIDLQGENTNDIITVPLSDSITYFLPKIKNGEYLEIT